MHGIIGYNQNRTRLSRNEGVQSRSWVAERADFVTQRLQNNGSQLQQHRFIIHYENLPLGNLPGVPGFGICLTHSFSTLFSKHPPGLCGKQQPFVKQAGLTAKRWVPNIVRMIRSCRVAVLSDVHYAGALEQARGKDYEISGMPNPLSRLFVRVYRHVIWQRDPMNQNHLLDRFLVEARGADYVIANGDYSCDSGFVGVSDEAACQSARECLDKLREAFSGRLYATYGDHDIGKLTLF